MSEPAAVFDPGLQPERTALSWRRTGLSLLVGSLAAVRVLAPSLGWWSVVAGVAGVAVAAYVFLAADRRHRTVHRLLTSESATSTTTSVAMPGGALLAVTAVAIGLGGLAALSLIVARMIG